MAATAVRDTVLRRVTGPTVERRLEPRWRGDRTIGMARDALVGDVQVLAVDEAVRAGGGKATLAIDGRYAAKPDVHLVLLSANAARP